MLISTPPHDTAIGSRRFVLAFLITQSLGLAALAGFNLAVDPGGRFRGSYVSEDASAALLLSGQGVVRDITMNEDYLNHRLATLRKNPPQMIALGSSRVGEVTDDLAGKSSFFNHAVGSALLDYHVGLLATYHQGVGLPHQVLLGVDPWIFSAWPDRDTSSMEVFQPGLASIANEAGIPSTLLEHRPATRRWQVFSLAVARTAWATLTDNAAGACGVRPLNESIETCSGIRADGSHRGSRAQMAQTPEKIEAIIRNTFGATDRKAKIRQGLDYIEADPARMAAFSNLLGWLVRQDVEVVLMLTPFHPLAEDRFRLDPPRPESAWSRFEKVETAVRAEAARHQIVVLGSYSSQLAGCVADEFVDWLHPRRSCVQRILAPLKEN